MRKVIVSFFHCDDDNDGDEVLSVLIPTSDITKLLLFFFVSGFPMPCTHPMANKLPSQTGEHQEEKLLGRQDSPCHE